VYRNLCDADRRGCADLRELAEVKVPFTTGQRTALRGLFFALSLVAVLLWAFFVGGCQVAQWRVFQKKVDGADSVKPMAQVEGEKRAAAYIVARTTPPVVDPAKAVTDVNQVATGLSASLGQPEKPVTLADKDAVIATLTAGLKAKDAQLDKWRAFGRKYAGTPLEDTGINLAGPAGLLALVGVIAACVFIPGFGYVLLRLLPLLWGFFRRTTEAIGDFAKANPDAGKELAATLGDKMDKVHKRLVRTRAKAHKLSAVISATP
jgi:hypothetical protein